MKTYQLTVIGNPVQHSKSPWLHTEFAKQFPEVQVSYIKTEAPLDGFAATLYALKEKGFHGASITLPFKEQAYALCDRCTDRAKTAKAVSMLLLNDQGKIHGDNIDGPGLITDLQMNHHYSLKNKNILIIGAGGAVRGILYPLIQSAPKKIILANRTENKAAQLAAEFSKYGVQVIAKTFEELHHQNIEVIIDGTSFNSWPLPLNDSLFSQCELVYDLKYGDTVMPIVAKARAMGIKQALSGFGMLVEQAAESFSIWTGLQPNTRKIYEAAKQAFGIF